MLIITDDPPKNKEFLEFKEKYFEKFIEANNGDTIKAHYQLVLAYRALKEIKKKEENKDI
jgi:hypothetical protein